CRGGREYPHFGAAAAFLTHGSWALVPGPLGDTGVDVSRGQTAGPLGPSYEPRSVAAPGDFAAHCRHALRLIESGTKVVVVNMFTTVYESLSWDCHADGGLLPTSLDDYRDTVCPAFDIAYSTLLDDLADRGLLDS